MLMCSKTVQYYGHILVHLLIFRIFIADAPRTVWEMKQKAIVEMAADRGAFIDQSQSLNIHMDTPTFGKLTSLHFYTWSKVSPARSAGTPCTV